MSLSLIRLLTFVLILSLWPAISSQAIIIRHDRSDSLYLVDKAKYPQIFYVHTRDNNKVCMGTLISAQWAITAAHCTDDTPLLRVLNNGGTFPLTIAGQTNAVVELRVHPNYQHIQQSQAVDLALLKLERPITDVEPAVLYRDRNELNQVVSFLGWGATGYGTVGRRSNDGKLRRAFNMVTKVDQWLQFHFDDPRQQGDEALELEGVPGLGDSGGPAFLETESGLQLIGVALGEVENPASESGKQGLYGATELYERVSSHLAWIDAIITNDDSG